MSSPFSVMMVREYCVVQHEILAIMGELATLFGREIPKSRSSNERSYPTLTNQGELHVPREASGPGTTTAE